MSKKCRMHMQVTKFWAGLKNNYLGAQLAPEKGQYGKNMNYCQT